MRDWLDFGLYDFWEVCCFEKGECDECWCKCVYGDWLVCFDELGFNIGDEEVELENYKYEWKRLY